MKRLPLVAIGAWLVLQCGAAWAQDGTNAVRALTLDDCIRLGLEQSGLAQNARRDVDIAETVVTQARAEVLPHLSADAGYTRLDEVEQFETDGETFEVGTLDNYRAGAGVSQLLYSGGRVRAALRAAGHTRTLAEAQRLETESRVKEQVRLGFYRALLAGMSVGVREESLKQLQALLEQTETRFRQGTSAEFDVISARVRLANEEPELIEARNVRELALADLRSLLGLSDEPFRLDGELACVPWPADPSKLVAFALANRPSILVAESVVRLQEDSVMAARAGAQPSVTANAAYNGANSYGFASFQNDWQWHWNAGVALSWDLWDGNLTRGRVAQKKLELLKSSTDADEQRKQVRLDVTRAFLDLQHAKQVVDAARGNIELAAKAFSIAQARYGAGLATRLDATDAALAQNEARLAWCRALFAHMSAAARLEFACGADRDEIEKGSR